MGPVNLDVPYFSLLVAFVLKHNVDEKNMQNIDVRTRKTRITGDTMLI